MKVSIVGGGGRVGSNAAYALQLGGIVKEIALIDVNREMADGEALDLRHGMAFSASQTITSGDYTSVEGSDIVVITAGLRRKPDESRLDLINRNVALFKDLLSNVKQQTLSDNTMILVVSNPVDILTYLAVKESGLPSRQVFGLGTTLDTCRFRSLLSEYFKAAATDVHALILGEHGDSMVPMWSSATINGISMSSYPGYSDQKAQDIFDFTKKSGAEVIRLKGGAGYAVGIAIKEVIEAIALDSNKSLPISTLQNGALGVSDVCYSLPTLVGRKGVLSVVEPNCSADEKAALIKSSEVLKETIKMVMR